MTARISAKLVGGLMMGGGTITAAVGAGADAETGAGAGAIGGAEEEAAAEEPLDSSGALRLDTKPLAKDTCSRPATGPLRVEILLGGAGEAAVESEAAVEGAAEALA